MSIINMYKDKCIIMKGNKIKYDTKGINQIMKQTKNRIAAALAVCAIAASFAACADKNDDNSSTSVVTNEQTAAVTEITYPEKDADGSQISVVKVTDASGNVVTDAEGAAVTEPVLLDMAGNVITNAQGAPVTPNFSQEQHMVATDVTAAGNSSGGSSVNITDSSNGPTINAVGENGESSLALKAGDEFTVKIQSLENPGYTSVFAWLDVDTDIFEITEVKSGDPEMEDYFDSPARNNVSISRISKSKDASKYAANPNTSANYETLMCLYFDQMLEKITDETVIATVKLKVKESAAAGDYILGFDTVQNEGMAQANTVNDDNSIVILTPKYTDMKIKIE